MQILIGSFASSSMRQLLLKACVSNKNRINTQTSRATAAMSIFMSMSTVAAPKLLFRQLFEKDSSTYTYLLADVAHPNKPALTNNGNWQGVHNSRGPLTSDAGNRLISEKSKVGDVSDIVLMTSVEVLLDGFSEKAQHGYALFNAFVILVDPVDKTIDRDLKLINELGLKLIYAMNTHVHADHVTGTGLIKSKLLDVKSVISKQSKAKADILVNPGDRIYIGNLYLEVRATPGHTEGCVTYVTGEGQDQPNPRMAFTGDALLIRGCGRTDFQGGSAEQLYKSVHSQIFTLPKETLLYPAHDYKGQTVTTVEEELLHNARLSKDHETFKNIMANLGLAYPKMIDVAVPSNMMCGLQDPIEVCERSSM